MTGELECVIDFALGHPLYCFNGKITFSCQKFAKNFQKVKKKQLKYCDCLTKKNVFPPTNIQQVIDAQLGPGKKNKIKIPFAKLLVRCCLSARSRRGTE